MCGIVGIVRHDENAVDRNVLAEMCEAIRHRGPDEDGFYLHKSVGLAMRRLAIIDLKGGQQPIHNEDRSAWIVFNGEIYNYRELRERLEKLGHAFRTDCDTEVIIHAYEQYGSDCPKYLRGMFAFAIWDERAQELFLARDRVGKKPLLYAHTRSGLVFGSEFQALLQHPEVSRDIECEAIHHYLSFLCVPAPLTAYKEIKKLEPGHFLRYRPRTNESNSERYWLPDFNKKIKITEKEAGERAIEVLRDAVRVRLMSEVPLGAFLSGGIDSSTVVALMSESSSTPVKTFSIGFEEQDFSELHHARRVAEHLGAEYHEFIVRPDALEVLPTLIEHYGEPYADPSAIPTYYVARETRNFVTVALNGDGGDETFGGYERYVAMHLAEQYHRLPAPLRRTVIEPLVASLPSEDNFRNRVVRFKRFLRAASLPRSERYLLWLSAFTPEAKRELYTDGFAQAMSQVSSAKLLEHWIAQANSAEAVDAVLLTDTMTYLPNDLLVKVDIASMAVSLEARSPFLDHHVIEFAGSLPENFKVRNFTTKYLLKNALREFLPKEILTRRKMGFGVPLGRWFRSELKEFLAETLLRERSLERGYFKPEVVKRMVTRHISGEQDYAWQLWALVMLELWFQRFIDK
jgi:asparagine synthase (glutamine-hydrolysing)